MFTVPLSPLLKPDATESLSGSVEYGTKVLHTLHGEGIVLREQIGLIEILFKTRGIVVVRKDDKRLRILEGVF